MVICPTSKQPVYISKHLYPMPWKVPQEAIGEQRKWGHYGVSAERDLKHQQLNKVLIGRVKYIDHEVQWSSLKLKIILGPKAMKVPIYNDGWP